MDQIELKNVNEINKTENPQIGNLVFNYTKFDKPIQAIPIVKENGEIVILTNIRAAAGRSRVVIQDLSGKEIKNLLNLGFEIAEITKDDNNIYIFTSNADEPMFYTFDVKTYSQKSSKPLGNSRIQSVCCDNEHIYTFDMESGNVQTRDKEGNVLSSFNQKKEYGRYSTVSHHNLIATSEGLSYAGRGDLNIDDEYRHNLEKKFGKRFMDLNYSNNTFAYDEKTQTTYVSSRNIIYVGRKDEIKGVMYFKDKSILGLDIDPITNSLMVSSSNWPEVDKTVSLDKGGSLEVVPLDMVDKKIKTSMEYLEKRYKTEMESINNDQQKILTEMESINNNQQKISKDEIKELTVTRSKSKIQQIWSKLKEYFSKNKEKDEMTNDEYSNDK